MKLQPAFPTHAVSAIAWSSLEPQLPFAPIASKLEQVPSPAEAFAAIVPAGAVSRAIVDLTARAYDGVAMTRLATVSSS